jgi:hypothetical protein
LLLLDQLHSTFNQLKRLMVPGDKAFMDIETSQDQGFYGQTILLA